ncbi:response regulator [Bacillus cereus]|uniref:DNA-binding response regulator n=1 Tax=Bacillus cereus TaxID=1396 RepID=A0A2A7HU63_BACCE|nr:response regulator transcription factor [Bacillus cereus]PEC20487.1 DNA-binding response regulator [Bacillus cereus]
MGKEDLISILIVDDHAIVRQGLNALFTIQPDFHVVGEAEDGEKATALATELVPDIVLMDLVMPGINGVEAIRRVKQVSPRSQVIVLTSCHEEEYIFPALRAGAISYVLKDIEPNQLVETVRRGVQGESIMHPRVVNEIRATKQASPNPFSELSERELEVLRLIARKLTNAEIAEGLFISEKTVKGHVSNILSKLHMLDRTKAAVFAWEQGFMHPNQEKNY